MFDILQFRDSLDLLSYCLVAEFMWKLRLRLSRKKISVTVSIWKMSKISLPVPAI